MKAGALNASSGYLVEAFIEINGESSSAIWTITTNILPYDGSCELRNASWGTKFIIKVFFTQFIIDFKMLHFLI